MYVCVCEMRIRAFQSTYRATCEPAKSRVLHTLHSIISISSACSQMREVVERANEWKRKWFSLLNACLAQSMLCEYVCCRVAGKLSLRIGLSGRGFLCSFCPPRMLGGLRWDQDIPPLVSLPVIQHTPTSPSVLPHVNAPILPNYIIISLYHYINYIIISFQIYSIRVEPIRRILIYRSLLY